ncbi:hypothetical protein EHI43_19675 [Rhizobium leguminosarum]|nr:hypothetical protein EHI43_19675 [Rhizobium leguminosarum]
MFLHGDSPRKASNFGIPKRGNFGIPKWDFFFPPTHPPLSAAIGGQYLTLSYQDQPLSVRMNWAAWCSS